MAKKNKNQHINLNNGPLKSVTIGEINEKKHGVIGVFILLALFIGLVFFLPEIQKYYQQYFGTPVVNDYEEPEKEDNNQGEQPDNNEDDTKYLLTETKQYTMDDIEINDITFEEGNLSFKAKNKTTNPINLNDMNLYFLTYDESGSLLNHVPIVGTLNVEQDLSFNYLIKSNSHSFIIKEMIEDDYPFFTINEDNNGISILTCTKANDKIIYTFKNDLLNKIEHTANYEKSIANYDSIYSSYNTIVVANSDKEGVTATITSNETSMNYSMIIDYEKLNTTINYKHYLAKDTNPRVVNFKLESDLFDCM